MMYSRNFYNTPIQYGYNWGINYLWTLEYKNTAFMWDSFDGSTIVSRQRILNRKTAWAESNRRSQPTAFFIDKITACDSLANMKEFTQNP